MEQSPFSIKVTISALGERRYRSRVEAPGAYGANFGPGSEFELDPDAEHDEAPSVTQIVKWLASGTVPSTTKIERFGQRLYRIVFRDRVLEKFGELKGIARERGCSIRICLALHAHELGRVPWEYLHDGTNFLLNHGYSIVRVFDELVGAKSSFAPVRRMLVTAADPDGYDRFDAIEHLDAIGKIIQERAPGAECNSRPRVSAAELLDAIRNGPFDAFYFLGHGEQSASGGILICEKDHQPERLEASDLALALREAPNVRFVYLNACSSARAEAGNPFRGVAQRLMLDGDVAAVAAMQVDVRQSAGLAIAKAFFSHLTSKGPEGAMDAARRAANDGYSFGIPVLYSYSDAPRQAERNYLETFLRADQRSKFSLVLPSFVLGFPAEGPAPKFPEDKEYVFPGETLALADTNAAASVINLLSPIVSPREVGIYTLRQGFPREYTHYFLFGSKSNKIANDLRRDFRSQFEFVYQEDKWTLRDLVHGREYSIKAPHRDSPGAYIAAPDFGVIQRFETDSRVYFLLAGLGSRATEGCGYYLNQNWRRHVLEENFTVLLKFPPHVDPAGCLVIDRRTGEPYDGPSKRRTEAQESAE